MLTVSDLHFRHPRAKADILAGVTCTVPEGLVTTILGPNGSGKTTLFKCLAGLWRPRQGRMRFGDRDLAPLTQGERAAIMAVVPQDHEPPFPYTVSDVVLMGRISHVSLFAQPSANDYARADEALEQMGIYPLRERAYTRISGGERQLVLMARALVQETPLLILDEPTSHLDFRNQLAILGKVRELVRRKGRTVLMTLHDPNLAMQFSDRVVMMASGRIMAEGPPPEVLTRENLWQMYAIEVALIPFAGRPIIHAQVTP